ncbi:MAG: trans-aconitate 2-methyltransferase [Rhodospirillaceae bacterium]
MSWDPALYLKYGGERTRPAADLLARVPVIDPLQVVDLGCGPGNSTALLAARWPSAHVTAIDSDHAMLDRAWRSGPRCRYLQADITTWQPDQPPDVIFSNAVLHWLDDHATLFPRLMRLLPPGGVLAVQMPCNFEAPSHALLRQVARSGPWAKTLEPLLRDKPVAEPEIYHRWVAPLSSALEIWETTYLVRLSGADPVLSWVRGTALRPLLDALDDKAAGMYEATYAERLREAYPREADGVTLFPFRRLFIVATRAEE